MSTPSRKALHHDLDETGRHCQGSGGVGKSARGQSAVGLCGVAAQACGGRPGESANSLRGPRGKWPKASGGTFSGDWRGLAT